MQGITQDSMEMDPHDPDEARWAAHYPAVGLAKVEHADGVHSFGLALHPMASVN